MSPLFSTAGLGRPFRSVTARAAVVTIFNGFGGESPPRLFTAKDIGPRLRALVRVLRCKILHFAGPALNGVRNGPFRRSCCKGTDWAAGRAPVAFCKVKP